MSAQPNGFPEQATGESEGVSQQAEISLKVSNKGGDWRKCEGALEEIPEGSFVICA